MKSSVIVLVIVVLFVLGAIAWMANRNQPLVTNIFNPAPTITSFPTTTPTPNPSQSITTTPPPLGYNSDRKVGKGLYKYRVERFKNIFAYIELAGFEWTRNSRVFLTL